MKKLIENPIKNFDRGYMNKPDRPIIYIRYKYLKYANNKRVCTYIGEAEKFSMLRQFRKEIRPGMRDNYDEVRILYAPKDKNARLYWEAYLVVKLLPMYQIDDKKLQKYIGIFNKRIMKLQGLIVEGTVEHTALKNKYKGSLFRGGKIPLGYKVVPVPNTKYISHRTKEITQVKIVEYDMDSPEYNMLMDIVLLYGRKNYEGYKKMSYRNLSDYIQKKYNKKLQENYIWKTRERELELNSKHWNRFYAS